MPILEVCIDTLQSARAAEAGGADRLELCGDLSVGGLTPSTEFALSVVQHVSIPIMMMVRPRAGNFVYSDADFEQMKQAVILAHKLKLQGVVFGILLSDNHIDVVRTSKLVALARPMEVTFHRAFDDSRDPFLALEQLESIGIDRLLTSGQQSRAIEATALIKELISNSEDGLIIMPGSGINSSNVGIIHDIVQAREYHGSFKKAGAASTSEVEVRKVVEALLH